MGIVMVPFVVSAQKVTLDYYFNREVRKVKGAEERFHYTWEDLSQGGFSKWGGWFKDAGATLGSLETAPTVENLKGTDVYIIVDPDSKKENPSPNYIEQKDIDAIEKWVKAGGVLMLMANDSANVELPHFNKLATVFGMEFNNDLHNHVTDDAHFADGTLTVSNNPIFKTATKLFLKDIATISIKGPAKAALKDGDAVIIATAKYGKGTVLAVGDPWLYNEYVNGRLPVGYENDKAAQDIARWLLQQVPKK
ncbi:hypothetical protein GCM10028827_35180 [Mucilaginibacter myungsuensis]|uniref:DUF4350 domain-containing protein n=2 Tax=Mucilaginibacter myungsuensis TaxID=649104 RepID=A0A929PXT7_9SPHI|nr:DUF4350 domain-containing protein [Mucilaginibacter myungsuensis]